MIRWVICVSWLCLCGASVVGAGQSFAAAASGARSTSLVAGGQQNTSANIAPGSAAGNFVDVGGAKIWYQECGEESGEANVVLLHDGLVHSVTWDAVWVPLCAKYHVVRYDRRGYGRSESAATVFDPVEDLKKVMRQVHMERGIIVGCSSGGGLAGIAGRPMKRRRHLVADCAVRAHLVVVSTPSLAFSPRLVEAEEPVGVQAFRSELAVQAFDERIIRWLAGTAEVEGNAAHERP